MLFERWKGNGHGSPHMTDFYFHAMLVSRTLLQGLLFYCALLAAHKRECSAFLLPVCVQNLKIKFEIFLFDCHIAFKQASTNPLQMSLLFSFYMTYESTSVTNNSKSPT